MTSLILQAISSSCCLPVVRRVCFLLRDSSDQTKNMEHQAQGRIPTDEAAVDTRQHLTSCGTSLGWIFLRYVCIVFVCLFVFSAVDSSERRCACWTRNCVRQVNSFPASLVFPPREARGRDSEKEVGSLSESETIDDTTKTKYPYKNSSYRSKGPVKIGSGRGTSLLIHLSSFRAIGFSSASRSVWYSPG